MTETKTPPPVGTVTGRMAEGMAIHRAHESMRPEGERICYDPYAYRFIDPTLLRFAAEHPEESAAKYAEMEQLFPGLGNSIRARVRFFDEFTEKACRDGITQLVLFGAGYDTRACRLSGLQENVRVFEVDRADTQAFKKEKVREIFGNLPAHVVYVPVDCEKEKPGDALVRHGFSRGKKTLFVLEGVIMYLPPEAVDETLLFIRDNAGEGSRIIFDYYPQSVIDGTDTSNVARNILTYTISIGEPLKSGIPGGEIVRFLAARGFKKIHRVTSGQYRQLYFTGKNADRPVCDLLSFVYAEA
jgi:methyltransferase (TIGR00027 family)